VNTPNFTSLDYMDSVPLHNMLRHVMPYVAKAPQAMALDLLRQKYIDFARRTRILCCEISTNYQAGVRDYYLTAPKDHSIYSIVGIEGGHYGSYWNGGESIGFSTRFDVFDNNCIRLRDAPSVDETDGLKVYVTLLPKECITYMPASLSLPFGQKIARGVVSDLLYTPNKEWSNPNLARKYELDYEKMLLSARALAVSNRKVNSNSIKPLRIL
jgi:hypothetical protein